jgi:hypothetical protein
MANEKCVKNVVVKLVGKRITGKARRVYGGLTRRRMSQKLSMKEWNYCQLFQDTVYLPVFLSIVINFEFRECVIPCPSKQMYSFQARPCVMNFAS